MILSRFLVIMGGLILIIASRMRWMSTVVLFGVSDPISRALEIGWEDNGYVTGMIGLILLLLGAFWRGKPGKRYSIPGMILAALAIMEVAGCFQRILEINPSAGFFLPLRRQVSM